MTVVPFQGWLVILAAGSVVGLGVFFAVPFVFINRTLPVHLAGANNLVGVSYSDIAGVLERVQSELWQQSITIRFQDQQAHATLGALGVSLNIPETVARIKQRTWHEVLQGTTTIDPVFVMNSTTLNTAVQAVFGSAIVPPQNATLAVTPWGGLVVVPSAIGEGVDVITFEQDVLSRARNRDWMNPLDLVITSTAPTVIETEVVAAQHYADQLLTHGLVLTFQEEQWPMPSVVVQRLLRFTEVRDPHQSDNTILGVTLDAAGLANYLDTTLRPNIDQEAVDARLELTVADGAPVRATQFALPTNGRKLNTPATVERITQAVAHGATEAAVTVTVTTPVVTDVTDIKDFGITTLLATGESDFAGSPANRRHNISVGTSRYHGVLVAPGAEFSFNDLLGPVDRAHGYKPELVIKANVTVPEFGGGLCQVSTTAFRAAMHAGLPIIERRNHSYAVRYYGIPGFDATIYPGHTDLRFTNDTPGYLLIQARVEGTRLVFELWGTNDGRTVAVTGPVTYDRQANGAVKATLKRTVTRNGEVIEDDTFYSRYKSPSLFPRAQATDQPTKPGPTAT